MPQVPVSLLKTGEQLIEDVVTERGNLLFPKGRTITARDIEILQAFLIKNVNVEQQLGRKPAEPSPNPNRLRFMDRYDELLELIKKVFKNAAPGISLPIYDLRKKLEALIEASEDYRPLYFAPHSFQIEDYLYHNSILVALTSYRLAVWHHLPKKDHIPVALGGLLHDIGSFSVDQDLLRKPGKLKPDELQEIRKHTIIGYNILKDVPGINNGVKLCALQHHEREDGSGYPLGVKGDKIHVYTKVVAIADMFHAMTSDRFHQGKTSPYLVLEKLQDESFGKLDPGMVRTFIRKATEFQNGSVVRLSDDSVAEIVFSDPVNPTRPLVKINGQIINLAAARDLYIQEVIQP